MTPLEFFVVPVYQFGPADIKARIVYDIYATFYKRADIVSVQRSIKSLKDARSARLRWCSR